MPVALQSNDFKFQSGTSVSPPPCWRVDAGSFSQTIRLIRRFDIGNIGGQIVCTGSHHKRLSLWNFKSVSSWKFQTFSESQVENRNLRMYQIVNCRLSGWNAKTLKPPPEWTPGLTQATIKTASCKMPIAECCKFSEYWRAHYRIWNNCTEIDIQMAESHFLYHRLSA